MDNKEQHNLENVSNQKSQEIPILDKIDAKHVDVIIKRREDYTGEKAQKIIDKTIK